MKIRAAAAEDAKAFYTAAGFAELKHVLEQPL